MAASGCAGYVKEPARCVSEAKHRPATAGREMTSGGTEPRTESEYAMACQCGACGGTGKCATCVGSGRAERTELVNARRTRRHRFDTHGPQPCGVWRFQALQLAKREARPMTNGEKMAKPDPAPAIPECAQDTIWRCSAEFWRPCARCRRLICEMHDYRIPVWPCEDAASEPANMLCRECVAELWYRGDISQGAQVRYLY